MSRKFRRRSDISAAEVDELLRLYAAGEMVMSIAGRFGCSGGTVCRIATAHGLRREKPYEPGNVKERPAPERGEVAFEFNGVAVRRDGDMMNLTALWSASGGDESQRPAAWFRHRGRNFLEHLHNLGSHQVIEAVTGRGGSTWADKHIALAYATDLNPALRLRVQEVFFAYMDGDVAATTPEAEARLDAGHAEVPAAVLKALGATLRDLEAKNAAEHAKTRADIIAELARSGAIKRKPPSIDTMRELLGTVAQFYNGMCPSCLVVPVMADGEKLPGAHWDHATDDCRKNRPDQMWLVCAACNMGYQSRSRPRENYDDEWRYFQKRRRQYVRQLGFDFGGEAAD